jgi:hypothetical protein
MSSVVERKPGVLQHLFTLPVCYLHVASSKFNFNLSSCQSGSETLRAAYVSCSTEVEYIRIADWRHACERSCRAVAYGNSRSFRSSQNMKGILAPPTLVRMCPSISFSNGSSTTLNYAPCRYTLGAMDTQRKSSC